MTKTYAPFDAGAGANTSEDTWRKFMQHVLPTGVIAGQLNQHAPFADSTGMQVKVKSGRSWILGHFFEDDAQETISIAAADPTNPRVDRLVLRADFTVNTIDYVVLQGTPAATPAVPGLTQSTTRWEIPIAQILVSAAVSTIAATKVTDDRQFTKAFNFAADPTAINELTNGELDVWQRGAGPYTATSAYGPDRYQIVLAGTDTLSVSQVSTAANKKTASKYSAGLTFVLGSGAGATALRQVLRITDGYEHLLGQTISARGSVKGTVGTGIRVYIKTDGTAGTTTFSDYHAGDGAFDELMVLGVVVPTDATYVEFGWALAASGTYYVDNAQVNIGAVPAAFRPLHPAEDLARCERYYEAWPKFVSGNAPAAAAHGYASGVVSVWATHRFRQTKAVVPTMTKNGTWAITNCGQPSVNNATTDAFGTFATAVGVGMVLSYPDSTDDSITAEANP